MKNHVKFNVDFNYDIGFLPQSFHPINCYLCLNWCYKNKVFQDIYMLMKDVQLIEYCR